MTKRNINDGGPVYPFNEVEPANGHFDGVYEIEKQHAGMSLRDHFAALAMQAMCAGEGARTVAARDGRFDETNWDKVVAMNAYEFADAMLAERAKATAQPEHPTP